MSSAPGTPLVPKESQIPGLRYVHYGCGHVAPATWENFDASLTLRWERLPILGRYTKNRNSKTGAMRRFPANVRYGDIVGGLPVPDASCAGAYCAHILEHLSLEELRQALANTARILAPGGIFRLSVPCLQSAAEEYLAKLAAGDRSANHRFLEFTQLSRPTRTWRSMFYERLKSSDHLYMWDAAGMGAELEAAGFRDVRRASIGDCEDPMFQKVEVGQECRWTPGNLCLEARRIG